LRAPPAGDPDAAAILLSAGRSAMARGATAEAVALLRRAVAEPPPADTASAVHLALGSALGLAGDRGARAELELAVQSAAAASERGHAALALGRILLYDGDVPAAVGLLHSAGDGDDAELLGRLRMELALATRFATPTVPLSRELLAELEPLANGTDGGLRRGVLSALAVDRLLAGRPVTEVAALAEEAYGDGFLLAAEGEESPARWGAIFVLIHAGRYELAAQALESALADARARGSSVAFGLATSLRALLREETGDVAGAEADAVRAIGVAEEGGLATMLPAAMTCRATALIELGDAAGAERASDSRSLPPELSVAGTYTGLVHIRGVALAALGRVEAGLELIQDAGRRQDAWEAPAPSLLPWRSDAALAMHELGRSGDAAALAAEEVRLARAQGAARALGVALRVQGTIEGRDDLLQAAVDALAGSGARLEYARALVAADGSRESLEHALELASACGGVRVAEAARAALVARGARPRRPARTGLAALTPAERQVAELAAAGASNRETAQTLFLTVKTVEGHLTSAYRKLGISGRSGLGAALAAAAPE
jgi:DNA-binding CsgD family transcriptional regulator